jgi:vacuolar-type H+-ATPase subunit F/Vma7
MPVPEFIGDEVSAAGYRLCGLLVTITDPAITADQLRPLIRQACARASLVLIGSDTASRLHTTELDTLLATIEPAVLIVPDIRCHQAVPDLATRLHAQLGILE